MLYEVITHFDTRTTIDTLDYSGSALNQGSKVVVAVAGPPRRDLPVELPKDFSLPEGLRNPQVVLPGVLALEGATATVERGCDDRALAGTIAGIPPEHPLNQFPLVILADDSAFVARSLNNLVLTS